MLCVSSLLSWDRAIADTIREYARLSLFDIVATRVAEATGLVSVLAVVARVIQRVRNSAVPRLLDAAAVAGSATLCAIVLNAFVLKPVFGRYSTWDYLHHGDYGFEFFKGTMERSSFPSGHTVMTVTFFSVLWQIVPGGRVYYAVATLLVATMLVAGGWHFLSDVFAGAFVGLLIGMMAAERRPSYPVG